MKLWLLTQSSNRGYDTYDSAVVAAESEFLAKRINPGDFYEWSELYNSWMFKYGDGRAEISLDDTWVRPHEVEAKLIGVTELPAGLILASFNAG